MMTETVITTTYGIPSAKYRVGIHAQGDLVLMPISVSQMLKNILLS